MVAVYAMEEQPDYNLLQNLEICDSVVAQNLSEKVIELTVLRTAVFSMKHGETSIYTDELTGFLLAPDAVRQRRRNLFLYEVIQYHLSKLLQNCVIDVVNKHHRNKVSEKIVRFSGSHVTFGIKENEAVETGVKRAIHENSVKLQSARRKCSSMKHTINYMPLMHIFEVGVMVVEATVETSWFWHVLEYAISFSNKFSYS